MTEDTFIDVRNYLRYNDMLDRACRVFLTELYGATRVTPCSGDGGTSNDMPYREKDEDFLHFAHRVMLYVHTKCYPGNKLRKSIGY